MSMLFRNQNGVETPVAGLNGLSGELVYGASTIRTGTVSGTVSAGSYDYKTVAFSSAMPDADYLVDTSIIATNTNGNNLVYHVENDTKATNGFRFILRNLNDKDSITYEIHYTVYKLYSVESLVDLETSVSSLEDNVELLQTNVSALDSKVDNDTLITVTRNTSYATGGSIYARRSGNAVQVFMSNVSLAASFTSSSHPIASGLPAAFDSLARFPIINTGKANSKQDSNYPTIAAYGVTCGWVNSSGELMLDINAGIASDVIWGSFTYICKS